MRFVLFYAMFLEHQASQLSANTAKKATNAVPSSPQEPLPRKGPLFDSTLPTIVPNIAPHMVKIVQKLEPRMVQTQAEHEPMPPTWTQQFLKTVLPCCRPTG
jgi:hypothetical protein